MKKILLAFLSFILCISLYAEIPVNYYADTNGKIKEEIKTSLHNIIREHTYLNYNANASTVWWHGYFRQTDWHPDGYFWDMYSNDKLDTYDGSLQNREHCMPRGWWATSSTYNSYHANGDLHNLYPSNATANNRKSNHPLGEVENASYDNGVIKVGPNAADGYTGTAFEPADEYKGDFARTYMYMVVCYEDYVNDWRSTGIESMLENNTYPTLNEYAVNLLLKWHDEDPVSEKEIDRNEAVYGLQGNRNPFIDLPEIAHYIWGDKKDETWVIAVTSLEDILAVKYTIRLYDNSLYIESMYEREVNCNIYTLDGRVVYNTKVPTNTSLSLELPQGIYIVEALVENEAIREKVLIK